MPMSTTIRAGARFLSVWPVLVLLPFGLASAADAPITHQISLPGEQSWCDDTMINGLFAQINTFRSQNGVPSLAMSTLGMKDAEMRASQFATYMLTTAPGSAGFNPHQGYDTTAAGLGYNIVSENLAYASSDPAYIVGSIWQDSLHLAALLSSEANVMGVSCVYDAGIPYWTYEPGSCTGSACGTTTPAPTPTPTPAGTPTLDSEEWAFLTLINNYRAQNGAGPLQVSVALENAAQWMSNDMAAKNYFSHTDSLGRSTGARLSAFGYTYSPWGEDLAAGYSDAQSTFDQWSTACDPDASGNCTYAHRQIMLGSGFTAIGIARASGSGTSYGWYWTTDFGGYLDQGVPNPNPGSTPASVPTIASFTASPSTITAGQSATLSWSVSGAAGLQIDNGIGDVSSLKTKGVTPSQTTTYTLTATNSSGSSSSHVTVTVTAAATTDTQAPSAPFLSSAIAKGPTEVDLVWTASADNVGVTGYRVYRNSVAVAAVSGTTLSYADLSVSAGASYTYSVRSFDAAGNLSSSSDSLQVTTPALTLPGNSCSAPPSGAFLGCYYGNTTLSGTPLLVRTDPQINFDWGGNTPDRAIPRGSFSVRWQGSFTFASGTYTFSALTSDGMRVYVDGNLVLDRWTNQAATLYTISQTLSSGTHLIAVEYYEATGWSAAHLTWHSAGSAGQSPSILSFNATPSAISPGQAVVLNWNATGATSINIDNGVGNVTGTTSKTVQPAQTTTYTLTATNSTGSSSSYATVTVNSVPDTQPPTAPVLTRATAKSSNEVDLAWTAGTDNVAVAGYQIFRNGSTIGTVPGSTLSYADTRVSPATSYTYALKAYDGAGNYSSLSTPLSVTTPAAPVSGGDCPSTTTNAFTGCYYNDTTLAGAPVLVRTDPQINFDWGGNPPDRSVTRGSFSVRWQGTFQFPQGQYTFSALTSDGMRLYIDGNLVLDRWNDQAATQYILSQTLSSGSHLIKVEYYEHTGWSVAHLTWQKN